MTTVTALPADKFDANVTFVRPDPAPTRAPLDRLAVLPGFNTRVKDDEYQQRVADLTASMLQHGFYEDKPFSVVMLPNDETIYIFDGEHRYDAARAASLDGADFSDGLPIAFAKDGATVRDLTIHLVHGNAGERLNQVEMAAVVRRLKTLGLDKDEIAKAIGKTTRHVDNLLVLAGAAQPIKKAVAGGQIAAAEAVKLIRKDPKAAAEKVAEAVKAAEARGKAKATPKTMREAAPTPMRTIPIELPLPEGGKMGDLLKGLAAQLREHVKVGDGDKLTEAANLIVRLSVVDHEAIAARAKREEERKAALAEREKKAKEREAEKARKAKEAEKAKKAKEAEREKARKAKEAEREKARKAKEAEKAKAAKAKEAAKAKAAAEKAKGQGPKPADQAKANAKAHLGTDRQPETKASRAAQGKAASGGKAAETAQKPAGGDSTASGTSGASEAESTAGGASTPAEDPNKGL